MWLTNFQLLCRFVESRDEDTVTSLESKTFPRLVIHKTHSFLSDVVDLRLLDIGDQVHVVPGNEENIPMHMLACFL